MIEARELTKRFHSGRRAKLAVDRLSFRVVPGEVYGLLGPNGAGKTTTLRMILGILAPTSGHAEVASWRTDEHPQEVKRRIGFASASSGLYPWLSVEEMLYFFTDLYEMPRDAARLHVDRAVQTLNLHGFLHQRCHTLSTGQQQRVNLARALVHDPPVMLLDEPTRGLDIVGTQLVFEYIAGLRELGKAVILCTHRLEESERICNRFGLLHQGRLEHEGTLAELQLQTGCKSLADMFVQLLAPSAQAEAAP